MPIVLCTGPSEHISQGAIQPLLPTSWRLWSCTVTVQLLNATITSSQQNKLNNTVSLWWWLVRKCHWRNRLALLLNQLVHRTTDLKNVLHPLKNFFASC